MSDGRHNHLDVLYNARKCIAAGFDADSVLREAMLKMLSPDERLILDYIAMYPKTSTRTLQGLLKDAGRKMSMSHVGTLIISLRKYDLVVRTADHDASGMYYVYEVSA